MREENNLTATRWLGRTSRRVISARRNNSALRPAPSQLRGTRLRIATASRNVLLIGLLVVLPNLTDARAQVSIKHSAEVTEAEYEVLSAYITQAFTGAEAKRRVDHEVLSIVIINTTQSDQADSQNEFKASPLAKLRSFLRRKVPGLEAATVEVFRAVNTEPTTLRPSFHLPVGFRLVEYPEIESILNKSGWPTYNERYPGSQGWLTLSRVGFNPRGNQALFYAVNVCGGLCASADYVVMEKQASGWRILKEIEVWGS